MNSVQKAIPNRLRPRAAGLRTRAIPVALWLGALFLWLSGFNVCVLAQDRAASPSVASASSSFAVADFDGDLSPDLATVQTANLGARNARYSIRFQLGSGELQSVSLSAPVGGLSLNLDDVNGDFALDLVVTSSWRGQPVAILLNDGAGHFSVDSPATYPVAFAKLRALLLRIAQPSGQRLQDASVALAGHAVSAPVSQASAILPDSHAPSSILPGTRNSSFGRSSLGRAPPFTDLL